MGRLKAVFDIMANGNWHTLRELEERTSYPEASVSSQRRDLRKHPFNFIIDKRKDDTRYAPKGIIYAYRLMYRDSNSQP